MAQLVVPVYNTYAVQAAFANPWETRNTGDLEIH